MPKKSNKKATRSSKRAAVSEDILLQLQEQEGDQSPIYEEQGD